MKEIDMSKRTCIAPGCGKPYKALGYCQRHYANLRRHGSIEAPKMTLGERFWSKVDKSAGSDGCWIWTASTLGRGYGSFYVGPNGGGTIGAHRFAYQLEVGDIPEGLTVEHRCHTEAGNCPSDETCPHRRCVNPAHLELLTNRENILRSYANAIAIRRAKTHCPQGHPYSAENTIESGKDGRRHRKCRICQHAALARFKSREALKAN